MFGFIKQMNNGFARQRPRQPTNNVTIAARFAKNTEMMFVRSLYRQKMLNSDVLCLIR